jgi:hypothetical protein
MPPHCGSIPGLCRPLGPLGVQADDPEAPSGDPDEPRFGQDSDGCAPQSGGDHG